MADEPEITVAQPVSNASRLPDLVNTDVNHTFGKVPDLPGAINGGEFGIDPIPFRDYGKNGFTGSVAYVF